MLHQRCLAGAVEADNGDAASTLNLQAHVDQGSFLQQARLIGVREVPGYDNGIAHGTISSAMASTVTAVGESAIPALRRRSASSIGSGIASFNARNRCRSVKMLAGGPSSTIRPCSITTTRRARAASSNRCVT